jgi:hypothetical protein
LQPDRKATLGLLDRKVGEACNPRTLSNALSEGSTTRSSRKCFLAPEPFVYVVGRQRFEIDRNRQAAKNRGLGAVDENRRCGQFAGAGQRDADIGVVALAGTVDDAAPPLTMTALSPSPTRTPMLARRGCDPKAISASAVRIGMISIPERRPLFYVFPFAGAFRIHYILPIAPGANIEITRPHAEISPIPPIALTP